jgi:hypothetical protein
MTVRSPLMVHIGRCCVSVFLWGRTHRAGLLLLDPVAQGEHPPSPVRDSRKVTAPRIDPAGVPRSPITTVKIMKAVHCALHALSGCTLRFSSTISPPAAPQPTAAMTKTTCLLKATLTPEGSAAVGW